MLSSEAFRRQGRRGSCAHIEGLGVAALASGFSRAHKGAKMLNIRKLLLLAVMAIAATVISVPAAFGQSENHETLEYLQEASAQHCPAVSKPTAHTVSGGCLIHATSEGGVELRKHVFGVETHLTSCSNEFHGRVNEDAEGFIINQVLSGAGCARQPCKEAGQAGATPWPAHGDEAHRVSPPAGETGVLSVANHREVMTSSLCIEPIGGGADETCEVDFPANQVGGTHAGEYGDAAELTSHGTGGFRCEVVGHWNSETGGAGESSVVVSHIAQENKAETP
jgi:hypothetical protein